MRDILERLKVWQSEFRWLHDSPAGQMLLEATAEIERLRVENADLREACVKAHKYLSMYDSHYEGLPALRAAIDAAGGGEEAR